MKVVYFQRKRPPEFFSLEAYFDNVRKHLPPDVKAVTAVSTYYSNGLFKRLYNCLEAATRQGDVNHVTGDVHFLVLLLKKKKTILTIHDLGLLDHPSPLARKILKLFWVTLPVRRAAMITAVSETTRRSIIQQTQCDPAKVKVIHTCIGSHFTRKDKAFNKQRPAILQIGTVGNKNGIRMAQALQGIPCTLQIIGVPPPELVHVLQECKIDYSAAAKLTDEEMLKQYEQCDILLFASTLEGFGMPIVEANTVGRVVVTSNVSSMPEIANDAACLVDPYDIESIRQGVEKVINNEDYRNELILKGYKNARRFNVEEVANSYAALYHQVVDQNNR